MNLIIISTILASILSVIVLILTIYLYYMIVMIILSWIPGVYEKTWYQKMSKISDFYIGKFRGLIVIGNLDFTPIIGFVLYEVALELISRVIIPAIL